ncbi:hypothetical protein EDD53_1262 [Pacificibacter maritimus]|uniref:Uncharacterized protein n=1 Tax=Pacificibacter maritimus TaxID=762213 RepID=A0A3N4UX50_9RHOB|nr:hypothetical protein [Pacificibacter maritimus]RPE72119.1 hypothetical protein EDD53_1262 [Pacificibacter maritimus]
MTQSPDQIGTTANSVSETTQAWDASSDPATWAPNAAPMDMPMQTLTAAPLGHHLATQIRHLLSGMRIGIRHEI